MQPSIINSELTDHFIKTQSEQKPDGLAAESSSADFPCGPGRPERFRTAAKLPSGKTLIYTSNPGQYLFADPVTLSTVALWLVSGVVGAIGARIFNSLFPDNSGDTSLTRLTLQELKAIGQLVREALAEDAVRKCTGRIEALTSIMQQYNNAPATSIDRLMSAATEAALLTAEVKTLGFRAAKLHHVAVNLELAVIQERLLRFGDPGEKRNLAEACKDAYVHQLATCTDQHLAWLNSRDCTLRPDADGLNNLFGTWNFCFDGESYRYDRRSDARSARDDIRLKALSESSDQIFGEHRSEIVHQWNVLSHKYGD